MKLVFAIIHKDDVVGLTRALTEQGFSSTYMESTGGFLLAGNATLLVGVDEERVRDVIALIRETCRQLRTNAAPGGPPGGAATIFVVDIEHFERV